MKRSFCCAGLILGALGLASMGCHQSGQTGPVGKAKPDDPTSWSDKELTKGDPDVAGASAGLPKSSRLSGGLSSEAQAVERSLGVGP